MAMLFMERLTLILPLGWWKSILMEVCNFTIHLARDHVLPSFLFSSS